MFYEIRHLTRYRYNRPVWQSMMEVRMHPLCEVTQRCFTFRLQVNPRARVFEMAPLREQGLEPFCAWLAESSSWS